MQKLCIVLVGLALFASGCGQTIELDVAVEALSPLCDRTIVGDSSGTRSIEADCVAPEAAAAADVSAVAGGECERVVVEDEYGFREVQEVCGGAAPVSVSGIPLALEQEDRAAAVDPDEAASTAQGVPLVQPPPLSTVVLPADGSALEYVHSPAPGVEDFVGSVDALDLVAVIRDRVIYLTECGSGPTAESEAELPTSVNDQAVRAVFADLMVAINRADSLCGQGDPGWVEAFLAVLQSLDRLAVTVDSGLQGAMSFSQASDFVNSPRRLAATAVVVYNRAYWAVTQSTERLGSDLWASPHEYGIAAGVIEAPSASGNASFGFVGGSVPGNGVDSRTVSADLGVTVANLSVARRPANFAAPWLRAIADLGALPDRVVWAISTHELLARCPQLWTSIPSEGAFGVEPFFEDLHVFEKLSDPSVDPRLSPSQNSTVGEFAMWSANLGRTREDTTRIYDPVAMADDVAERSARLSPQYADEVCTSWFDSIGELRVLVETWGSSLGLILHPVPERLANAHRLGPVAHEQAGRALAEFADTSGIFLKDFSASLSDEHFRDYGGHFNENGRQTFSQLLADDMAGWSW